jgi:hypothetical protein
MPASMSAGPESVWPTTGSNTRTGRGWPPGAAEWAAQQNALLWSALVGALSNLQRGQPLSPGLPELAGVDREALQSGTANELPALKAAFADKGGSPAARATIDVVAGVLDYVFDDPYLPDEIKTVFGRLQIPMLRAALLDQRVVSDSQHPVRRFFDTLAQASVDLKPETARGRAMIELANRLAHEIRDGFDDDLGIFETAKSELDAFLDTERADANERLAKAVPPLIAQDERADARAAAAAAPVRASRRPYRVRPYARESRRSVPQRPRSARDRSRSAVRPRNGAIGRAALAPTRGRGRGGGVIRDHELPCAWRESSGACARSFIPSSRTTCATRSR